MSIRVRFYGLTSLWSEGPGRRELAGDFSAACIAAEAVVASLEAHAALVSTPHGFIRFHPAPPGRAARPGQGRAVAYRRRYRGLSVRAMKTAALAEIVR